MRVGMLMALGAHFYDINKKEIPLGGMGLLEIDQIDLSGLDSRLCEANFTIASDVKNPLYGKKGASVVFGPQKGATPQNVFLLDKALKHFAQSLKLKLPSSNQLPKDGAAGGMGYAFRVVLNATLKQGIDLIIDHLKIEEMIERSDLIITGEGKFDEQTLFGKAPMGIVKLAKKHHKKVIGITGNIAINPTSFYEVGFTSVFSITPRPMDLDEAMNHCEEYLELLVESIFKLNF